ncbi:MAG: hypothetical protein KJO07_21530, partial [Deltaproteobacteria bacterium]|nr:hypothetical protein [Deltaproteobacteria bacterium]
AAGPELRTESGAPARHGSVDRRALIVAVALAAGCGASIERPRDAIVLSRGALGYAAAIGEQLVFSAELRTRFELVAYELDSGKERWRRDLGPADYDQAAVAVGRHRVWVASTDGVVRSFQRLTGKEGPAWALGASATSLAITDDRRLLLTATNTGVLCVRRVGSGALLQCLAASTGALTAIATRGDRIVTAASDGTVAIWSLPTLAAIARTRVSGAANAVALGPDGQVAIARGPGPLRRTPAIARREQRRGYPSVDREQAIVVWVPERSEQRVLVGHRGPITDLLWLDADTLLSSSWDRSVRRWSLSRRESREVGRFPYLVRSLAGHSQHWVASIWARKPAATSAELHVHRAPRSD